MAMFKNNWLSSHWVDFEYKKYTLLGYLKQIEDKYRQQKVYPYLTMLQDELDDISLLSKTLDQHRQPDLPTEAIDEAQANKAGEDVLEELYKITQFAQPKIASCLNAGKELEAAVSDTLLFLPVGLLPVQKQEGYLIFQHRERLRIYQYQLRLVTPGKDNDIHSNHLKTWLIDTQVRSRFSVLSDLKHNLIKANRDLPNPATFAVVSSLSLPYPETLVPIGRKWLYDQIAAA